MELTYTWASLGTVTGCTAAVVLITQYLKGYLPKWLPTRIFVLLLASAILLGVWWFGGTERVYAEIPLIVINAFVVALAAMGAYSTALADAGTTVTTLTETAEPITGEEMTETTETAEEPEEAVEATQEPETST